MEVPEMEPATSWLVVRKRNVYFSQNMKIEDSVRKIINVEMRERKAYLNINEHISTKIWYVSTSVNSVFAGVLGCTNRIFSCKGLMYSMKGGIERNKQGLGGGEGINLDAKESMN